MIGSFITRGLVMVFGYAYPAYECFKTVEKNKPEIEQLRFWCQYWILVAVLTVSERIGDAFISWVPMYSEAKLAFFIYLWYPKTKGTTYVYDSFFRPYVAKHETEIDRNLLELRTRAGDIAVLYWQKAATYGQTRVFEILQYVASQSTPRPRPAQPQQTGARVVRQNSATVRRTGAATQPQTKDPPSPVLTVSSDDLEEVEEVAGLSQVARANSAGAVLTSQKTTTSQSQPAAPVVVTNTQKTTATQSKTESASQSTGSEPTIAKQIEESSSTKEEAISAPPETLIDEAVRVTRGRLRKARSASNR